MRDLATAVHAIRTFFARHNIPDSDVTITISFPTLRDYHHTIAAINEDLRINDPFHLPPLDSQPLRVLDMTINLESREKYIPHPDNYDRGPIFSPNFGRMRRTSSY